MKKITVKTSYAVVEVDRKDWYTAYAEAVKLLGADFVDPIVSELPDRAFIYTSERTSVCAKGDFGRGKDWPTLKYKHNTEVVRGVLSMFGTEHHCGGSEHWAYYHQPVDPKEISDLILRKYIEENMPMLFEYFKVTTYGFDSYGSQADIYIDGYGKTRDKLSPMYVPVAAIITKDFGTVRARMEAHHGEYYGATKFKAMTTRRLWAAVKNVFDSNDMVQQYRDVFIGAKHTVLYKKKEKDIAEAKKEIDKILVRYTVTLGDLDLQEWEPKC